MRGSPTFSRKPCRILQPLAMRTVPPTATITGNATWSGVVVMAMQTADNHTRLVRKRQVLWPFSRSLTTRPDPDQPFFAVFNPTRTHESGMWEGRDVELAFVEIAG